MRGTDHVPRLESAVPGLESRTPFAVLGIRERGGRLVAIDYLPLASAELAPLTPLAADAVRQLQAYVENPHAVFDLPVATNGTTFEDRVWAAIGGIPAGQVRTYGEIARAIRSVPRAVGGACGRNPLPLLIPCHRVVAAGGKLGGFMGGKEHDPLAVKRWLLRHEGARP
ncbi:MAG: methylated-DNA--[protein]-cysteine S-methyltransferase [Betaproteobacteria bacterium]|nr:methylated-DNA--[protein]-cysteine S-methyltransferase [Betaproteobacteria bacterium]